MSSQLSIEPPLRFSLLPSLFSVFITPSFAYCCSLFREIVVSRVLFFRHRLWHLMRGKPTSFGVRARPRTYSFSRFWLADTIFSDLSPPIFQLHYQKRREGGSRRGWRRFALVLINKSCSLKCSHQNDGYLTLDEGASCSLLFFSSQTLILCYHKPQVKSFLSWRPAPSLRMQFYYFYLLSLSLPPAAFSPPISLNFHFLSFDETFLQ